MKRPPLGPGAGDITWPDQVAPWGRKASSTRNFKPQTSKPRGGAPGHGNAHAADGCCQDSRAAHIPHPQIPAVCSHADPNGPSPPRQTPVLPTTRTCPMTYHPTRNPHHAYTPSTRHNTGTVHTSTTSTAHTPCSMRARQAPILRRHHSSTGTANRQPPHVPSACASGYHRQP